jgi:hypothetical protein
MSGFRFHLSAKDLQGPKAGIGSLLEAGTIPLIEILSAEGAQAPTGLRAKRLNRDGEVNVLPDDLIQVDLIPFQKGDLHLLGRVSEVFRKPKAPLGKAHEIKALFHGQREPSRASATLQLDEGGDLTGNVEAAFFPLQVKIGLHRSQGNPFIVLTQGQVRPFQLQMKALLCDLVDV